MIVLPCLPVQSIPRSSQSDTCYAGCPQLFTEVGQQVINGYKQMGLDPKAVGEAAYRLAVNPNPPLRNIIMTDDQFSSLLPLWCRYDHMSGTSAKLFLCMLLSRRSAAA